MYRNILCTIFSKATKANNLKLCYNISKPVANSNVLRLFQNPISKVNAAWFSSNPVFGNEEVTFDEVKKAGEDKNVYVIDVREPEELRDTGVIPGSINIPLGEVEAILKSMSADEFSKKYGREKPSTDTPLIFSCKLGKRSATAQQISRQLGFKNARNYLGGWLDWEAQNKK